MTAQSMRNIRYKPERRLLMIQQAKELTWIIITCVERFHFLQSMTGLYCVICSSIFGLYKRSHEGDETVRRMFTAIA